MAQVGRKKGGKNSVDKMQLSLDFFPKKKMGRPKKNPSDSKINAAKTTAGLRLKFYENVLCNSGELISGFADQYGRVMTQFINTDNAFDIKPSGLCIAARH